MTFINFFPMVFHSHFTVSDFKTGSPPPKKKTEKQKQKNKQNKTKQKNKYIVPSQNNSDKNWKWQ